MSETNEVKTSNNSINDKIQMILRQTNYTEAEAEEKLTIFKEDHIQVIKDFLGIKDKREEPILSVNQEIYKQLRIKLNANTNVSIEK
jgi:hypothetical protein